ncbi:hypothetical protein MPH_03039 [Macrophomina phaseolina MS6]|uniref:Uncharacterized protein n=1 Tax=Macrophomina phaseolina (strain MS6) TaxID=1126212 RepID=K2SB69_MACPH|nr:hypothetical protein MPH_03039 [Macrophomina phaseolina MS6]
MDSNPAASQLPPSLSGSHHPPLHPASATSPISSNKRTASRALGTGNGDSGAGGGSAAKKEKKLKGKWTEEEEKLLIKLRSSGMKWVDISQQNPGRSATACRLRYQNYTEKKEWAEDEKDMLARLYHRDDMRLASDPKKMIDELVSTRPIPLLDQGAYMTGLEPLSGLKESP